MPPCVSFKNGHVAEAKCGMHYFRLPKTKRKLHGSVAKDSLGRETVIPNRTPELRLMSELRPSIYYLPLSCTSEKYLAVLNFQT